jgi:hypothetical protein
LSSPSFAAAISSCFCAILNGFSSSAILTPLVPHHWQKMGNIIHFDNPFLSESKKCR